MARYFGHISSRGPVKYGDVPGSIGALEAPYKPMPIGEAHSTTWDGNGLAVWLQWIRGHPIAGR
jgi:hypothetical protein